MLVEGFKYFKNYENVTQRQEVSKCCSRNSTNRVAWHRVATNQKIHLRSTVKQGLPSSVVLRVETWRKADLVQSLEQLLS